MLHVLLGLSLFAGLASLGTDAPNVQFMKSEQECPKPGSRKPSDLYYERFSEIEYRAFRAFLLHYKEAGNFDWWAQQVEWAACLTGFVGAPIFAFKAATETTNQKQWGLVAAMLAAFAGGLKYSATGSSDLLPSLTKRAQNHVNAGAEMTRIHRLAKFYKSDLQAFPPGDKQQWDEQFQRYDSLLKRYEDASKYTIIRPSSYTEYKKEDVLKEYKKRMEELAYYLKEESRYRTAASSQD